MTNSPDAVQIEGANPSVLPGNDGATLTFVFTFVFALLENVAAELQKWYADDEDASRPFMDSLKIQLELRCEEKKILKIIPLSLNPLTRMVGTSQVLVGISFVTY